ncbi:MAG TPA: lasso peptide biosynthesis B2 protein [Pyrinomonadaceae bacterium]|nr:lasso peptide biosynthesis B2 protein [Pyrinomonadaceae bacterium]
MSRALRVANRAVSFAAREPRSALLLLRMAFWVATLTLLMKLRPLPVALRLLTPRARPARRAADREEIQTELARLLDQLLATDFWVFTPTCWKRAPVLHRFLALRGIHTRIVFGVRQEERRELDGHAWLEAEGKPLLETNAPNYTVTFSHPS